ncbi:MAG: hypothetical protein PHU25_13355, partial [Deltaproteobacteria bacterium]|nr:hypothetical protein [Deltaproteobacteria bacterium]
EQDIPEYTNDDIKRSTEKLIEKISTYAKQEVTNEPSVASTTPAVQHKPSRQLELFPATPSTFTGMVPHATKLLVTIAQELLPIAQAYKKAGLSASQGNSAKAFLEEQGLAVADQCRLYKGRGRQPVILEPTQKGLDYLKNHQPNVKPHLLSGRGGLEHRLHVDLVARHHAAQGRIIKKEHKDADLGIEDPQTGTWLAAEVVTKNEANIEDRIQKNREAGAEKTIVICSDSKTAKRLAELLGDLVEVQDIEPYLEERKEKQNG